MSAEVRCPECGAKTALRTALKGPDAGKKFRVCTRYPECQGRVPIEKINTSIEQSEGVKKALYCTNCGEQLTEGARLCAFCGTVAGYQTRASHAEYESDATTDETEGGSRMSAIRIVYGLGIGVLIAMVVIMGFLAFYEPPYSVFGNTTGYAVSVLLIAGILGLVLTVCGLMLRRRINPIKLGMLSGGFIILLFAIIYPSLFGLGLEGAFGASFVALIVLVLAGFFALPSKRE